MLERLKELPKKFLEYWNKWTSKQKTIIISSIAAVILLIGILVFVLGRTKYIEFYTYTDTKTASQVVTLLEENTIQAKLGSDNMTVLVDEKAYSDAIMKVSTSELADASFGIDGLLDTSITTTNGERLLRNHLYLKEGLIESIKGMEGIVDVNLTYIPKDTANRILSSSQAIPASVMLWTDSSFKKDTAIAIAKMVAYALGNTDTDLIKVVDAKGNVLFDGPEVETDEIDITDKIATQNYLREQYIEAVTGAILMNGYTKVDVAPYLDINFDKVEQLFTEYLPYAEGEDRGLLVEYHETSSDGTGTTGDIPGTDSNDDSTDYYLTNSTGGDYSTYTEDDLYEPTVRVTNTIYDTGTLSADASSISVTANRVIERTEEDLELLGLLEDTTFEEYVLSHSDPVLTETNEDLVEIISMATGIPVENIKLMTYDIFQFTPKEEVARNWTFYLQILLAVVLFAFLIFVVFRGMAPVEVTELEPELSVEQLLATTKENQSLEDVEFSEQSETRKMIEKFFDENPEAVAQLLRNWLNSDWE